MSIASRLGLATSRLHVTARHVATGRLWAGGVATTSASRVRTVVVAVASGEWRVRSMAMTGRCMGSSVSDNYSCGLAITKCDCGSLSGAVTSVGVRARAGGRLGWHTSIHSLSDSNVRNRAAGRLFRGDHRSVLSGSSRNDRGVLSRSSRNDRADRLARGWNSGNAVGLRCGVRGQDVSSGQRGAVVGGAALCEDRRAVRHELGQGLSDRVAGGRVDDRGCVAWDMGSCRLCRLTAVLTRGHSNGAGGEGSGGVSTAGDSHGAGRDSGVCCGSLRVVLWWLRFDAGGPASSWVRSASGIDWRLTMRLSGINRGFSMRLGGMSWRLTVRLRGMEWRLVVSSSRIDGRLAPA